MSTLHVKYLLIGGGIASSAAAEEIRRRDREGDMLLISQEINRPYRRDPLRGAYLKRELGHDDLFTLPERWLAANHVELHTGLRAVQVDTARQCVTLNDGEDIAFDQLLIGTGSFPQLLNIPGNTLPGLLYLRTIEQADTLIHTIDKVKLEGRKHDRGRGRAVVVGCGIEAMELSQTLFDLGIEVEVVLNARHPWEPIAGEATGKLLARELEAHGIKVHASTAEKLEGDGRVQRIILGSGESVQCDFVVAMLGNVPNKELVRATAVTAEKAILTDDHCRTSAARIFAAGGCAVLNDRRFDRFRTVDAHTAGTIAGANMAGGDLAYEDVGTQRWKLFGLELLAFGEAKIVDHRLVRCGEGKFAEIGIDADGRVAHVISSAPIEGKLVDLVRHRSRISGSEEDLKDPQKDIQI